MRGSAAFRTGVAPGGALAGPWVRNPLWRNARAVPSLDLQLADNKSLVDGVTGQNLVTFTRASSGTYVGSNGLIKTAATNEPRFDHNPTTGESLGLLVEEARTNLLLQSEDLATTWTPGTGNVITVNTWTAPDGTLTGDQFTVGTASTAPSQNVTVAASSSYTLSFYLNTLLTSSAFLRLRFSTLAGSTSAFFNVSTLAFGTLNGITNPTVQRVGTNIYKLSVTYTYDAVSAGSRAVAISSVTTDNGATADTGKIVAIWGMQYELGAFPTSYIPTTTATVTRAVDVASITGSNFGITRTNVVLQSEDFSTTWTNNGSSENVNAIIAPDGTLTADALVDTAVSEIHAFSQSITGLTGSTSYTFSCFMKKGSKDFGVLVFVPNSSWAGGAGASVFFNLNTGAVGTTTNATASIQAYPNGWYRCIATATTVASPGTVTARIGSSLTGGSQTYTGAGDEAIYVWGAQLEAASAVTPYIPTTTAAVSVFESSWYNHGEGTLRATASIRGGNTVISSGLAILNSITKLAEAATVTNGRALTFNTTVTPNRYSFAQRSSISNITLNDTSYETIQFGKYYTLIGSYVNNSTEGLALSVDGRTVLTNATAVDVPVPTRLLIGAGNTGANSGVGIDEYYLNGTIKRLTYWPVRLSNTTLQQITQP
jgi:hypothetical protein